MSSLEPADSQSALLPETALALDGLSLQLQKHPNNLKMAPYQERLQRILERRVAHTAAAVADARAKVADAKSSCWLNPRVIKTLKVVGPATYLGLLGSQIYDVVENNGTRQWISLAFNIAATISGGLYYYAAHSVNKSKETVKDAEESLRAHEKHETELTLQLLQTIATFQELIPQTKQGRGEHRRARSAIEAARGKAEEALKKIAAAYVKMPKAAKEQLSQGELMQPMIEQLPAGNKIKQRLHRIRTLTAKQLPELRQAQQLSSARGKPGVRRYSITAKPIASPTAAAEADTKGGGEGEDKFQAEYVREWSKLEEDLGGVPLDKLEFEGGMTCQKGEISTRVAPKERESSGNRISRTIPEVAGEGSDDDGDAGDDDAADPSRISVTAGASPAAPAGAFAVTIAEDGAGSKAKGKK